jgi:hypothetical protein
MDIYLEIGSRRVFAAAVEWPGWCRSGRDEAAAIAALLAHGERYRAAVGSAGARLRLPGDSDEVSVLERVRGGASTDFGAPGSVPELDGTAVSAAELKRLIGLHLACWQAFERVADRAAGHDLAPAGPRGGGRGVARIGLHVAEAEAAYIRGIGVAYAGRAEPDALREGFVAALRERAAGRLPEVGPRGGRRWPARYAVRRSCWHLLDHAWEIEDRLPAG